MILQILHKAYVDSPPPFLLLEQILGGTMTSILLKKKYEDQNQYKKL